MHTHYVSWLSTAIQVERSGEVWSQLYGYSVDVLIHDVIDAVVLLISQRVVGFEPGSGGYRVLL